MNFSINNCAVPIFVSSLKWTDKGYVTTGTPHEILVGGEVKQVFDIIWNDTMDSVSFALNTSTTELYNMLKDNMLYELQRFYNAGRYESFMDYAIVSNAAIDFLWKYMKMNENFKDEDDSSNKFVF